MIPLLMLVFKVKVKVKYSMKITALGKRLKFIANYLWIRFSSGPVSCPNKVMKFGVVIVETSSKDPWKTP